MLLAANRISRDARPFPSDRRALWLAAFVRTCRVVKATLEFPDHSRQMPMHRDSRAARVVRRDRANDRRMVAYRLLRQAGRMKVLLHPPPQLGALIPQSFDDEFERAVARGLRQPQMEIAVAVFANRKVVDVGGHALDAALQVFDIGGGRTCCRERGDLAFDELARVEQFEWTRAGIAVSVRRSSAPGSDKNSGPDAHLDQSADLQRNNGFAHR